ncbi:hypothetical protein ACROYT_G017540 [Oculina patagonica]
METSSMETDEVVVENPIAEPVKTDEVAPVEVSETRAELPEMEKTPVQQVNILDLTKLSPEVQQGYRVFIEMSADSYKNVTWPFMEPVDAEALGLWDYNERIKEPMSFHQIGCKFNNYEYNSITEVVADIRLILENCYRYNGSDHWVSKLGHKMEKILEQKLALLNRSLRDKVSLEATMALRSDFIPADVTVSDGTGRRRTAARVSYVNMINGEESSSLLTRLKIQEDIEERERRRIREKEKKEANLVLLQDLAEWEEKELGANVLKQLHSMWEIPSLAGLLFLLKDFLYIQDLSITELELGFVYANKSSLLARIFTALLITPHQRKSLFKKPPMKFKVWESKLCDRLTSWYKAIEKDGQLFTCHQLGLDMASFEMLGEVNPLLEKSYMDLTLHQRVWILKCLCDNSLVRDYDFREHLSTIAPTEQRDMVLGSDADSWSYLYFPIFSASDLRIYKQCPLDVPTLSKRKKKVAPPPPPPPPPAATKTKGTPTRTDTPTRPRRNTRLRKLRSDTPSPEPEIPTPPSPPPAVEEEMEPKNTIPEGFELVASDVESLKKLCEKFEEPPPPPKKRGRKPKPPPPRKRCEVDLHQTLLALLEELEQYEMSFSRMMSKAKIKIMKESQEPEPVDEPEEDLPAEEAEEWGSEASIGEEIEDAGAKNMSSDEDFILDDDESKNDKTPTSDQAKKDGEDGEKKGNVATQSSLPQKRKAEDVNITEECKQPVASPDVNDDDDDPCSIAIQTAPPRLKKKKKKHSPSTEPIPQTAATVAAVVPRTALPKAVQGNQNISHVPAGMQVVKEKKAVDHAVKTSTSVHTTMALVSSTVTTGAVSVTGALPSSSLTQAVKNTSSVRIHSQLPVTLNTSTSSATSAKPGSLVVVPSSHVRSATSAQAVTVSKNLLSTAVTLTPQQARLPAGVGKVMLVSSSGVPLQVLKTMPVSQAVIQGKTVNPSVLTTPGNTRVCVVSSSTSLTNPVGLATLASSSPSAKSATSQLPSSAIPKVAISIAPTNLSSVLSSAKQTSHVSTTSASPLHPPVFLVQRSGAGGVVPLTVKGGAIVMSAPSASQQLVVIRPSSALTSSTTSTTTLLSGAGISVLGNAQFAQTALGQRVVLSGSTSLPHKTVVQEAKAPLESKPSELKTTSQTVGNKPVVVMTTASPSVATANKTATTSVTVGSNSAVLETKASDSKPTCSALAAGTKQVEQGKVASSVVAAANKQLSNVGSIHVGTGLSETVTKTLASNSDAVKVTDTHTVTTVSPDTQTVVTLSPETDSKQMNATCEDKSLPAVTINTKVNSQPENIAVDNYNEATKLHEKDKDAQNGSDPLVDLTCYETSVSDSAGCEESDDSAPNGLHPDLKTSLPCKLAETDAKLCNGVNGSASPDTKCEEKELDSVERSHAASDQTTNGVVLNET